LPAQRVAELAGDNWFKETVDYSATVLDEAVDDALFVIPNQGLAQKNLGKGKKK
jgi:hypothetical protein